MEPHEDEKKLKRSRKQLKKDSSAYIRQREKANARKRKFLDKMSAEQKEIKRAKDREYYRKKKAEKKVKNIADMTEREKRKQRKKWKEASKKYRAKKNILANIMINTPPHSDDESVLTPRSSAQRRVGRKLVRKDRAKAYRKIEKQEAMIAKMRRKIDCLKKQLQRNEKKRETLLPLTPESKVNDLIKDTVVPSKVRKRLLFGEVLSTQLQNKLAILKKNSKAREGLKRNISGSLFKKYKLLHMAKTLLPRNKTEKLIHIKPREVVLKPDIRQKVTDFFERDDVSRMCPAKRDFVKRNGIKRQKRVLLSTVKALTPKFVLDTGINLSYATLLRAKPFWVAAPKSRDRETCLCVKHDNFELKINKLKSLQGLNQKCTEDLIKDYSCEVTSYDCMYGLCNACKNITLETGDNESTLTYFQWQSRNEEKTVKGEKKTFKITKKVTVSSTMKQLKMALAEEIPAMKKHLYGIYMYNKLKKELKEKLTEKEVMVQIDFSENYTTKYAKEIQSTHFSKNQLSIHTGVYYSRNDGKNLQVASFSTVSENLDHQAHAIWAHMRPILTKILENKNIDTLHVYSDGPTSQYRNRTNIHLWLKILIDEFKQITKSTWTFSEPGHGKGPMDGVGGALKRTADSYVLMGKDIRTASDFANLFTASAISVIIVPDEEVTRMKEAIPKTLDAIPGIMNVTNIIWEKRPGVAIKLYQHEHFQKEIKLSTFSNNKQVNIGLKDVEVPMLEYHPEKPTKRDEFHNLLNIGNRHSIYKSIYDSSSSDEEDLMTIAIRQKAEQRASTEEAGTSYGQSKQNMHPNNISPGTFLLVRVPTQSNVFYRYVATSQTCVEDDGEVRVTFLRSVRNSAKVFKLETKDISHINFEYIIEIIPTPSLKVEKNRNYYYFETDIDIFEKV